MKLEKAQRALLLTSIALLATAFALSRVELGDNARLAVGIVEVALAIALGIGFGLTLSSDRH